MPVLSTSSSSSELDVGFGVSTAAAASSVDDEPASSASASTWSLARAIGSFDPFGATMSVTPTSSSALSARASTEDAQRSAAITTPTAHLADVSPIALARVSPRSDDAVSDSAIRFGKLD